MKGICRILLIGIFSLSIWSEFPVDMNGMDIISDVFWSSRGTWHRGLDMTTDSISDSVYALNSGKVYWTQTDIVYPYNNYHAGQR